MALLRDIFRGDDEPAWEMSELEIAQLVDSERELADLEREVIDWLLAQEDDADVSE